MIHKLHIPYEDPDGAKSAFNPVSDFVGVYRAEPVLAVARTLEFGTKVKTEAVIESSHRYYTDLLQLLKTRTEGLLGHFKVIVGHPAESSMRYAEDHGIDHIAVGHRGLFERWLLGSVVARQVVTYAHCAVTLVRPRG